MTTLTPHAMTDRDFVKREDETWQETAQKWLAIRSQIEVLECEEKQLREALIEMADSQNATGCGIRLTRSLRKGNVDYSQIPELTHVDLEKYRKEPIEVWRLVAT